MHFLPDVWVECEECRGRRYNRETLAVEYRGKTIADILEMEVKDAREFFVNHTSVSRPLALLDDVGLGYMKLGQSATTLSGGEAQRVKLARELGRRVQGRILYLLDEPTTGLHFDDVARLVHVLHRLVDQGHTAVVIEHNLDVIESADWIIDLGPEGGDGGGSIVVQGPPEVVAKCSASHTGRFLARSVARARTAARMNVASVLGEQAG
jgi:excinuclease ABC subunit A